MSDHLAVLPNICCLNNFQWDLAENLKHQYVWGHLLVLGARLCKKTDISEITLSFKNMVSIKNFVHKRWTIDKSWFLHESFDPKPDSCTDSILFSSTYIKN